MITNIIETVMTDQHNTASLILGLSILLGLLGNAAIQFKEYERSVTVKGLSEHEYGANIVLWPIQFTAASNDIVSLYSVIEAALAASGVFSSTQGVRHTLVCRNPPNYSA
jgi:hypothetical protein